MKSDHFTAQFAAEELVAWTAKFTTELIPQQHLDHPRLQLLADVRRKRRLCASLAHHSCQTLSKAQTLLVGPERVAPAVQKTDSCHEQDLCTSTNHKTSSRG
jgi:hypothetical protein